MEMWAAKAGNKADFGTDIIQELPKPAVPLTRAEISQGDRGLDPELAQLPSIWELGAVEIREGTILAPTNVSENLGPDIQ